MDSQRRIFLFRDIPTHGIKAHLELLIFKASLPDKDKILALSELCYVEGYRFGNDYLITETDYIVTSTKLAYLRQKIEECQECK